MMAVTNELLLASVHADARYALKSPFFFDIHDPQGPFGGKNGHLGLNAFWAWRPQHPEENPDHCLSQTLHGLSVPNEGWLERDPERLGKFLSFKSFEILTRDDIALAMAFAQVLLDGYMCQAFKEKALYVVERQSLPEVLTFRHYPDPQLRHSYLLQMSETIKAL